MPILFFFGALFTNSLYKSVPADNTILEDISGRPALALTMLAAIISGIVAFTTGLVAVISQKERAPLVYIATLIGALLVLYLISELTFPH